MSILDTITASDVRDDLLAGLRMTSAAANGARYTDAFILGWLRRSAADVARVLDIVLTGEPEAIYHEKLDGIEWDTHTWALKTLKYRPVLSVERFAFRLGNNPERLIPNSWPNIASANQGQVVMIPTAEVMPIIEQFSIWWRYQRERYVPLTFRIDTKAGFTWAFPGTMVFTQGSTSVTCVITETQSTFSDAPRTLYTILNGRPWLKMGSDVYRVLRVTSDTTIELEKAAVATVTGTPYVLAYPEDLRELVMLMAAIPILELMGTTLYGNPGMTSKSLSLDALTQGKGISVGKGFGPYSALINNYADRAKTIVENLYGEYAGINFTAL